MSNRRDLAYAGEPIQKPTRGSSSSRSDRRPESAGGSPHSACWLCSRSRCRSPPPDCGECCTRSATSTRCGSRSRLASSSPPSFVMLFRLFFDRLPGRDARARVDRARLRSAPARRRHRRACHRRQADPPDRRANPLDRPALRRVVLPHQRRQRSQPDRRRPRADRHTPRPARLPAGSAPNRPGHSGDRRGRRASAPPPTARARPACPPANCREARAHRRAPDRSRTQGCGRT